MNYSEKRSLKQNFHLTKTHLNSRRIVFRANEVCLFYGFCNFSLCKLIQQQKYGKFSLKTDQMFIIKI